MSKFWKIWIVASCLLIAAYLAAATWYWPSRVEQAYERGKIDGQLLVFEKWGTYSDKTVEQLVECIHLRAIYMFDSLEAHYDPTDTMPAKEAKGE